MKIEDKIAFLKREIAHTEGTLRLTEAWPQFEDADRINTERLSYLNILLRDYQSNSEFIIMPKENIYYEKARQIGKTAALRYILENEEAITALDLDRLHQFEQKHNVEVELSVYSDGSGDMEIHGIRHEFETLSGFRKLLTTILRNHH